MMSKFSDGARRSDRESRFDFLRALRGLCLDIGNVWLLALVLSSTSMPAVGAEADVAVVVHPDVAVENPTIADLRRGVLGDREFSPASVRITLLLRAPVAHERD